MDKKETQKYINLPSVRKSAEFVIDKNESFNNITNPTLIPCATSTLKKSGSECLTGLPSHYFTKKSSKISCDSSLGILDMDVVIDIEDNSKKNDMTQSLSHQLLSFNPQEISGKSTNASFSNVNKENCNPNSRTSELHFENATEDVKTIIKNAKIQSEITSKLLNSTYNFNEEDLRMSLQIFKESRSDDTKNTIDMWDQPLQVERFTDFSSAKIDSEVRDSMFTSKINLSEENLSPPQRLSNRNISFEENLISTNETIRMSNFYDSKISVGNYFVQKCGNIRSFLDAPSPNKKNAYSPSSETTLKEGSLNQNSPIASDVVDIKHNAELSQKSFNHSFKTPNITKSPYDLLTSNSLNDDDTLTNNPLSITQIRSVVGKMDTEDSSMLLDQLLGKKKNRYIKNKTLNKKIDDGHEVLLNGKRNDEIIHKADDKMSPERFINVKNDNATEENAENILLSDNVNKLLMNSHLTSDESYSNAIINSQNTNNSTSSRGFSKSSNSNISNNTIKNINTILPKKKLKDAILENDDKTKLSCAIASNFQSPINERKNSSQIHVMNLSPGILSISNDNNYQELLTPSDTCKEIKDLMSPLSMNCTGTSVKTPISGRHIKKLIDHYPDSRPPSYDNDGWISPNQKHKISPNKECILSVTPFGNENTSFLKNKNLVTISENSILLTPSIIVNNSVEDDWIKLFSLEQNIIVGVPQNLKLNVECNESRWLSLNISIKEICIDNQFYSNISNIIILQEPTANILLTAPIKSDIVLKVIAFVANKNIKIHLNVELLDIVTKNKSIINHILTLHADLPNISIKNVTSDTIDRLEFPPIPENCETCTSLILANESDVDIPIQINITNAIMGVFELNNVELFPDENKESLYEFYSKMQSLPKLRSSSITQKTLILPSNRKSLIIILISFIAPKIYEDIVQTIQGSLNILLTPACKVDTDIFIRKIPITGKVGTSTLLLRNNQKSDVVTINQGFTEDIEMYNAGTIPMHYKIYFALYQDKTPVSNESLSLIPCKSNLITLDRSEVTLQANEKSIIKVSFSSCTINSNIKRLLVFESPYSTEVFDIIGIVNFNRCQSQQSTCSIESVSTQSQTTILKSTKKELSWGSIKLGETKIQDVVFKNISSSKKIRLIATVIGESFKVLSDNGPVSTLVFTLQPQECRAINLEFKPNSIRGHIGTLKLFNRCSSNIMSNNAVEPKLLYKAPLHGIGGQSKLVFRDGVFRHAGTQGLPLGPLNDTESNKQIFFTIWNKGITKAFVMFNIDLKWKYRTLGDDVYVTPSKVIIEPEAYIRCTVNIPRRATLLTKDQTGETETIASLFVLHGDEATRLRIKRIYSNHIKDDSLIEVWNNKCQGKLKSLCSNFPNEDNNYIKINHFTESSNVLWNLLDELQQKDVSLTYDVDLDYSVARLSNDVDETLHFHTITEDLLNTTLHSEN